ncbi:DUF6083 domain-containing protein [Streptomyces sp. NPDC048213]|uniref:DUF6083 domain-containing protein n=1 Tax=Streptomyces sp. NPDC048213 TaxID=3160984 RepID=UPI0033CB9AD4
MPEELNWDGSPVVDKKWSARWTMRIHKDSSSQILRRDATKRCIYCHHPIEWYERFDTQTWLPLLLQTFPSHRLPVRYQWSVFNGLAYLGDGGSGESRIAHPAVCPAVAHDDDPVLRGLRRSYALRTRRWVETAAFTPAPKKVVAEEDVAEQIVQADSEVRHIITYTYVTLLGPAAIDRIQCVALARSTGERCLNRVLDDALSEGQWTQVDIPMGGARRRQGTLWEGQKMWVYDLNALFPDQYKRWRSQRCASHAASDTPGAGLPPQWVPFNVTRHPEFIAYERPKVAGGAKRGHPLRDLVHPHSAGTRCSGDNCTNRSHRTEEDRWLCWKCEPLALRRARVHQRWQASATDLQDDPPF